MKLEIPVCFLLTADQLHHQAKARADGTRYMFSKLLTVRASHITSLQAPSYSV